ncbi:thiolase family protein [Paenibacillus thermoaerophilus]|uniref:acetyl-CoA C-acyltransferase n=1 Tax=Paenibacillus thermoaerophilus TaxID=1215385 RepID=A0ABW2V3N9_9BACL|nr:thiolase family protein [Paenibacillus thermoaerophilus]TMV17202.1 thiolase family protein [Paenibacillus thermoaerophilus]
MREAVIVSAVRTPVGRAHRGVFRHARAEDLAAAAVRSALGRVPALEPDRVDDVILGCAMPEGEQGLNLGRLVVLRAGLPDRVSGLTVNRFCASGLQAIAYGASGVMCGGQDAVVVGGVESMSHVPMSGFHPQPNPALMDRRPEAYTAMGITAERVAERYGVGRDRQDAFAFDSHRKAAAARREGRFDEEIAPVAPEDVPGAGLAAPVTADEGIREDTSPEALAKLKPAFLESGRATVTAGNSSQMSDGAAALVVVSGELAASLGLRPLAKLRAFATSGVSPDVMGIGPVEAIPRALRLAGLRIEDIGLVELNEAFAAQCLACIDRLELDPSIVNVNGGAIALGHPLGATGAKLTATLLHEARRRGVRYGLVSMCVGGGMGAAGIFEILE